MAPGVDATAARPEPTRRLPPQARTLWRLEAAQRWGLAAIGVVVVLSTVGDGLPGAVRGLAAAVVVAGALTGVLVLPGLRWRRWRYEVREEEVDLLRGALTVVRTLVPMARVQHVDTRQGFLEQALDLSTVVFHTAAGAIAIPALHDADADDLRNRIAALARTPDTV